MKPYYQDRLTHISLFAGIAGDTLAAQWAGFKTVLFVENDKFCQKVLNKHWSDVPLIGDIRDVTKETIANAICDREKWGQSQDREGGRIEQDSEKVMAYTEGNGFRQGRTSSSNEIQQENGVVKSQISSGGKYGISGRPDTVSPITLITGGFPCQPVSVAGKQRGKEDDRWLWPEMLRVISEIRPTWVVAENVAGLLRMGFRDCISDLESEGYETTSFLIPACAVNAPHRRDRVFIVAHNNPIRCDMRRLTREGIQRGSASCGEVGPSSQDAANPESMRPGYGNDGNVKILRSAKDCRQTRVGIPSSQDVADTKEQPQREPANQENTFPGSWGTWPESSGRSWWAVEPDVGRVAHGVPSRVDRLKGLGNAVVPQQIYPILKAIADMELKV